MTENRFLCISGVTYGAFSYTTQQHIMAHKELPFCGTNIIGHKRRNLSVGLLLQSQNVGISNSYNKKYVIVGLKNYGTKQIDQ